MKRLSNIFVAAAVSFLLTGCGIYNKYEQTTPTPADAFGTSQDMEHATGETSIAQMSWREFFTDPLLQQLIEQVLANNTDLNSARIAVEKSQAALTAAKLAYLPSLAFAPQGTLASFDNSKATKTYNLPLQLSWDIDVFGSITNKKRAAKAVLLQAQMQEEAVRANLISATAQQYFLLQVLDRQQEILTMTDSLWNKSLETEQSLWENGKAYSTAVNQMEASYLSIKTQIVDNRRNIRSVENAICQLLAVSPRHIDRQKWGSSTLHHAEAQGDEAQRMFDTKYLHIGVPAMMLQNRPDIRMANHAMEEAFYNTAAARSAFYPSITLSGSARSRQAAAHCHRFAHPAHLCPWPVDCQQEDCLSHRGRPSEEICADGHQRRKPGERGHGRLHGCPREAPVPNPSGRGAARGLCRYPRTDGQR